MNSANLTQLAERAGQRYALLLEGFRGILGRYLTGFSGFEESYQSLTEEAYGLARNWLAEEERLISEEVRVMGEQSAQALQQTPSEEALAHLDHLGTALATQLRIQIERDVAVMLGVLRDNALRNAILVRSGGATRPVGTPIAQRRQALSRVEFEFMDRGSKAWPSQRHVRTLWRHALVLAWNETALITLVEMGQDSAVIAHPDPGHSRLGDVVNLINGEWETIRDDVFHPNTQAYLVMAGKE